MVTLLVTIFEVLATAFYCAAETPPAAPNSPVVTTANLTPLTLTFTPDKTRVDFSADISISSWVSTYKTLLFECKDANDTVLGTTSIGLTSTETDRLDVLGVVSCILPSPGTYKIETHLKSDNDEVSNTDSQEVIVTPAQ